MQVNGKVLSHSATLNIDKLGRDLPAIPRGVYKLNANQLWVYGTVSDRSWDSRYFGAIDRSLVVSVVKPLITWS
jgi:type IV secretory pathway protease TraF